MLEESEPPITDWIRAAILSVESLAKACTGVVAEGEATAAAMRPTVDWATVKAALRAAEPAFWEAVL